MFAKRKGRRRFRIESFRPYVGGKFELRNDVEKNHIIGDIKNFEIHDGILLIELKSSKKDVAFPETPAVWSTRRIFRHEVDLFMTKKIVTKGTELHLVIEVTHDKILLHAPVAKSKQTKHL